MKKHSTDILPVRTNRESNVALPQWDTIKYTLKELFSRKKHFDLKEVGLRSGDVAVITGGARGIGANVVKKLLQCDCHVVMGLRTSSLGETFVDALREAGIVTGTVTILPLNLKSLNSVREFGKLVLNKFPKIHILICNAAIRAPPFELTDDGFESQFQVNYLSPFLLTNILLKRIIQTAADSAHCGRIVNVSSLASYRGRIGNILNMATTALVYDKVAAYRDSKLCQIIASNYLNKLLESHNANVYCYFLHPGMIPTEMLTGTVKLASLLKSILRTVEDRGDVILSAAVGHEFEKRGGIFLMNSKIERPNSQALDETMQEFLWKESCQMLGINIMPC